MKISEAKRQVMLQQWTERIKEQKASGMKVNARCKERGIGEGQFYYCQNRCAKPCQTAYPRRTVSVSFCTVNVKARDQSCKAFWLNNSGLFVALVQQPLFPFSLFIAAQDLRKL